MTVFSATYQQQTVELPVWLVLIAVVVLTAALTGLLSTLYYLHLTARDVSKKQSSPHSSDSNDQKKPLLTLSSSTSSSEQKAQEGNTTTTTATTGTMLSPNSTRTLLRYRMKEERKRQESSELSRRGVLWTQKASWHLPQAPLKATRQHELYATELESIKTLLQSYQVDLFNGFLPSEDPLQRLPYARYHLWEDLADDIPKLLGARLGQAREPLRQLPVLAIDKLVTEAQLRRAHLLLCVFAHAYVWGGNTPIDIIPQGIAKPLWEVSAKLGIPPVLSHTSLVLYNWRRLDCHADICIENLATLNNFFDGRDESWFYLITAEIEAKGGSCVIPMMLAIDSILRHREEKQSNDNAPHRYSNKRYVLATKGYEMYEEVEGNEDDESSEELVFSNEELLGDLCYVKIAFYVTAQLNLIAEGIRGMHDSLLAMREGCHPFIFYHRVRPFLSGWKHNPTLPDGVLYEGVSEERFQFFGGSAAQSPIIPFLDIGLGIEHHSNKSHDFLLAMRDYMLKSHRDFLSYMERVSCIRSFVLDQVQRKLQLEIDHKHDHSYAIGILSKLQQSYDDCVHNMEKFRTGHIAIVAEYIMAQQKEGNGKKGLEDAAGGKGTGGTELMKFLKPLRDDCTDRLISASQVASVVDNERFVSATLPSNPVKSEVIATTMAALDSPISDVYLKDNGSSDDIDVFQKIPIQSSQNTWNHPVQH